MSVLGQIIRTVPPTFIKQQWGSDFLKKIPPGSTREGNHPKSPRSSSDAGGSRCPLTVFTFASLEEDSTANAEDMSSLRGSNPIP